MTDAADGCEIIVADSATSKLAGLAAFQAFTDTADAEAARATIVDIEDEIPTAAHAIVAFPVCRFPRTPGGAYRGTADLSMTFCCPCLPGETIRAAKRRAGNHLAAIRRGLLDAYRPLILNMSAEEPIVLDISDGLPGWVEFGLAYTVEVQP